MKKTRYARLLRRLVEVAMMSLSETISVVVSNVPAFCRLMELLAERR